MKIVTIIGARPQIIKGAAISRAIANQFSDQLNEVIVHTGQHYDENMSGVFFEELGIPKPNHQLAVGSAVRDEQIALMEQAILEVLQKEKPKALIVYGDTNSTAAGAYAAEKADIPMVHIEAGLRSFNQSMPEELNRILCDERSTLLFCPTKQAIVNLEAEGFTSGNSGPYTKDNPRIYHCGDIMYDNSIHFATVSDQNSNILSDLEILGEFVLATVHRPANTDDSQRLQEILETLCELAVFNELPIILPLHPRTRKMIAQLIAEDLQEEIERSPLKMIDPVSFLDMIALEKASSLVITDSGGVQKEAYYFNKPSLILRDETEWVEIVDNGSAILCDANRERILKGFEKLYKANNLTYPNFFGDGKAAAFICQEIITQLR
ncbi:UDP-N-acetylglucosamine 2-epimerase (non-hydrolyzing) [Crocinitomix catalasitica]|nr:UDP-N-acetylglucosamine 2-epimerase (non-hydrolyzing) [Crocinitomix catalasitica]